MSTWPPTRNVDIVLLLLKHNFEKRGRSSTAHVFIYVDPHIFPFMAQEMQRSLLRPRKSIWLLWTKNWMIKFLTQLKEDMNLQIEEELDRIMMHQSDSDQSDPHESKVDYTAASDHSNIGCCSGSNAEHVEYSLDKDDQMEYTPDYEHPIGPMPCMHII